VIAALFNKISVMACCRDLIQKQDELTKEEEVTNEATSSMVINLLRQVNSCKGYSECYSSTPGTMERDGIPRI